MIHSNDKSLSVVLKKAEFVTKHKIKINLTLI